MCFFADIDGPVALTDFCLFWIAGALVGIGGAVYIAKVTGNVLIAILMCVILMVAFMVVVTKLNKLRIQLLGGEERFVTSQVEKFVRDHPEWHLRVYRTPNGIRLLAMHQEFDPRSEEVERAFFRLGADRTYQVMCQKQNCFRARLTAKPWRIGISDRLRPRPGVWPVSEEWQPQRKIWIDEYESSAANYAACKYVASLGALNRSTPTTIMVRDYHDRVCRATEDLELA